MLRIVCIASAICLLAGCATDHEQLGSTAAPSVKVKMTDFHFSPRKVEVNVGDTVEWENGSIFSWHTVTCDASKAKRPADVALPEGAQPFDSGKIKPKESYRYTFTAPGEYRYFCQPHEKMGMVGEVIVRQP